MVLPILSDMYLFHTLVDSDDVSSISDEMVSSAWTSHTEVPPQAPTPVVANKKHVYVLIQCIGLTKVASEQKYPSMYLRTG
jgi:hypothetical protein